MHTISGGNHHKIMHRKNSCRMTQHFAFIMRSIALLVGVTVAQIAEAAPLGGRGDEEAAHELTIDSHVELSDHSAHTAKGLMDSGKGDSMLLNREDAHRRDYSFYNFQIPWKPWHRGHGEELLDLSRKLHLQVMLQILEIAHRKDIAKL
jgi:hypothetical protein